MQKMKIQKENSLKTLNASCGMYLQYKIEGTFTLLEYFHSMLFYTVLAYKTRHWFMNRVSWLTFH